MSKLIKSVDIVVEGPWMMKGPPPEDIARREGERYAVSILEAKDEAERTIGRAHFEAQRVFEQAKERGMTEGYAQGLEQGTRENGQAQAQASAQAEEDLQRLWEELETETDSAARAALGDALRLAAALAEKVLDIQIDPDDPALAGLAATIGAGWLAGKKTASGV